MDEEANASHCFWRLDAGGVDGRFTLALSALEYHLTRLPGTADVSRIRRN